MRKSFVMTAAGAAAIGLFLVGTAQTGTATSKAPIEQLSLMSRAQAPADRLPAFVAAGTEVGDLVGADTTRRLGSSGAGTYWSGVDAKGRLCLITVIGDQKADFAAGASCAEPSDFAGQGVGLQVAGPPGASEAYLLPDGVPAAQLGGAYTVVAPNLVLSDPAAPEAAPRSVAGAGGTLTLSDLSPTVAR
ncbi:hypothetical protein ACGFJC_00220 [Nonomuraea fuscirosea]|uniref:hypothetical protein n=1 Tax=Nonomuraea fuscirosea TaxID=1291556 RepID=UPI0037124F56